jgi:hypothetical protein
VDPTTAVLLGILVIAWIVLAVLTFRPPDGPKIARLIFFQLFLLTTVALGYLFLVKVYKWNPNPLRVEMARGLTKDRMIYLGDFVPGLYDLDYIKRIDTDWESEGKDEKDTEARDEWLAFYRYDVTGATTKSPTGPFGAVIYDHNQCRPPAILSFELVPVNYDYLGQDGLGASVEDIIPYPDPLSGLKNRPEVIVNGLTRGAVTDLNIFREVGVPLTCLQWQQWQAVHPGQAFPNSLRYENIGSFRGNYLVERSGATVTVVDRSPFERSQITIRRQYRPEDGSYFRPGTQVLLDPVESSLAFGPGEPDVIPEVYYPEKAVLAFYRMLGKDQKNLEVADKYLSPDAQVIFDIKTDPFGLAMPRKDLARVLVWEIRYEPDVAAEQLHQDREVTVTVAGVDGQGNVDHAHPCHVTWTIIGYGNASALPYGCEWRLDSYWSDCVPGK